MLDIRGTQTGRLTYVERNCKRYIIKINVAFIKLICKNIQHIIQVNILAIPNTTWKMYPGNTYCCKHPSLQTHLMKQIYHLMKSILLKNMCNYYFYIKIKAKHSILLVPCFNLCPRSIYQF